MDTDVFPVPRSIIRNREDHIVEQCRGKTVLHLGCCDYPFAREAIENGRWLHGHLQKVAKQVTGLELSEQGLNECRNLGYGSDIFLGDACSVESIPDAPFERIVAGEIIEHVPNPGAMLTNMRRFLHPNGRLIITTPNAFSLRKQLRVTLGKESVHRDHVCYFSHRTLARLLVMSGYTVVTQTNYALHNRAPRMSRLLEGFASRVSGGLLEGLYTEAIVTPHFN